MADTRFSVTTHRFEGQHVRQFAGATRSNDDDVQYLEAKQYIPFHNVNPRDGDVTILGVHALGFPKELYQPLWQDFLDQCDSRGVRVRSIWIADMSNSGASGVLNERTQGDDPSFFDYARDLLHMINVFRDQIRQPIVGIGHSLGGTALLQLSLMHPRILASIVLYDPVIGQDVNKVGSTFLYASSIRPDVWSSHAQARAFFRNTGPTRSWDARVLDLWLKYGLRETPTLLYPEPGNVTLAMTRAQEAWGYCRNWFEPLPSKIVDVSQSTRTKFPDFHDGVADTHPFYYVIPSSVWDDLPRIRPGVMFVFAGRNPIASNESMREMVKRTGTGNGGSGGRVSCVNVEKGSHLLCFEKPSECADIAADWLERDLKAWRDRQKYEEQHREDKSVNKVGLSKEWIQKAKEVFERHKKRDDEQLRRSGYRRNSKL